MIILKKDISENFIVNPGIEIKLSNWDPTFTGGISKSYAENLLENDFMNQMSNLQYKLFADKSQALLVVLQGMDASGKDGTIRHAMKALNPQSCKVFSFKKPTDEEISHDYLWKIHRYMPAKGEIAIFNRSHYEAVIEERVHKLVSENTWSKRYDQINEFEQYLFENNFCYQVNLKIAVIRPYESNYIRIIKHDKIAGKNILINNDYLLSPIDYFSENLLTLIFKDERLLKELKEKVLFEFLTDFFTFDEKVFKKSVFIF